jgi:shikimate dehydrogenase
LTDLYAVIGNPVGHTKSPIIHKAFAAQTGQDLDYIAIEGTLGGFAADVDAWRAKGLRGLNVTAPFKLDAFAYADRLQDQARLAGAVNCLSFDAGGAEGANYDGVGLVRDIVVNLGVEMKGRRILLLGSGGATRGALAPFLAEEPAELVIGHRAKTDVGALCAAYAGSGALTAASYESLAAERGSGYDLVINATSTSLFGEAPPIAAQAFRPGGLAYDLSYGKGLTPFLQIAKHAGAGKIADGVGMLVEQAAEAFERWRGLRPATGEIIARLTIPLV